MYAVIRYSADLNLNAKIKFFNVFKHLNKATSFAIKLAKLEYDFICERDISFDICLENQISKVYGSEEKDDYNFYVVILYENENL